MHTRFQLDKLIRHQQCQQHVSVRIHRHIQRDHLTVVDERVYETVDQANAKLHAPRIVLARAVFARRSGPEQGLGDVAAKRSTQFVQHLQRNVIAKRSRPSATHFKHVENDVEFNYSLAANVVIQNGRMN